MRSQGFGCIEGALGALDALGAGWRAHLILECEHPRMHDGEVEDQVL